MNKLNSSRLFILCHSIGYLSAIGSKSITDKRLHVPAENRAGRLDLLARTGNSPQKMAWVTMKNSPNLFCFKESDKIMVVLEI
jgi:hypothetical protein